MTNRIEQSVTLRIPGDWDHPGELVERLPAGFQLTPEKLRMPEGTEIDFTPLPPDGQFAGIFRSSCRRPPSEEELAIVNRYSVNICLTGPGGSMDAALKMMKAGAAVIEAGGAGVFIDNSALAHGGGDWIAMTEDASSDAVSFAFAAIIRGEQKVYTMGMNVLGLPDLVMRRSDLDEEGDTIVEIIRYVCQGVKPFGEGHIIADLNGPRFQAIQADHDKFPSNSIMHNPFGRLKLVSMNDIAEGN